MNPQDLIKAILINAACVNAEAVCQNTTGSIPVDPQIADTGLQGKGVMVYEEAKIQYNALLRAFQDKSGVWPDPQVASGPAATAAVSAPGVVANLVEQLVPALLPILTGKLLGKNPAAQIPVQVNSTPASK